MRERERECVLAIKLESKSKENPSKNVWEGVRVERVSMRAHHPSLRLYLKEFGRVHPRNSQAQWSGSRWRRWGPGAVGFGSADLWGQSAPGWAPWCPPLARCFLNGYELWKYVARPKVCSKRCPNYFSQRILKLRKYFWSFCKKGKVLEKFQNVENNFENFKHAVEKNK